MNLSNTLLAAAVTGIMAGVACGGSTPPAEAPSAEVPVTPPSADAPAVPAADGADAAAAGEKHECAKKNACKGQGGCKTGDKGCKGQNSCKGNGGCKTM